MIKLYNNCTERTDTDMKKPGDKFYTKNNFTGLVKVLFDFQKSHSIPSFSAHVMFSLITKYCTSMSTTEGQPISIGI